MAPPVSGTNITMRVLSTRTDLGYNSELTDPKKYSYDITENAMCADVSSSHLKTNIIILVRVNVQFLFARYSRRVAVVVRIWDKRKLNNL